MLTSEGVWTPNNSVHIQFSQQHTKWSVEWILATLNPTRHVTEQYEEVNMASQAHILSLLIVLLMIMTVC